MSLVVDIPNVDIPDLNGKPYEEHRWIPVTERLPEKTGWYLCTLLGHSQTMVDMCRFFEMSNGGFWRGGIEYNVVAWMPLPEPYEGSETNETN